MDKILGTKSKDAGPVPAPAPTPRIPTEMDLMKEKFGKLLLGEDMSGGGKGVSSALALSNAITNLAASVFGELKRLEPLAPDSRAKWRREVDWLLSVTEHIVELVPSQQSGPNGITFEVMMTKQRLDLQVNIPALRKLDAMLTNCLENFQGKKEFSYVDFKDANEAQKAGQRNIDKWWIPTVQIPTGGLSDSAKRWLQNQKDAVNQVLKAAMAINAQVLGQMEVPESYIDSLPKNARSSLGDLIYKGITEEFFDPDTLLSAMDLSSELKVLDLKNKIEASIIIWKRKMNQKDGKSSWGSGISIEKRELFEERLETMLLILKHHFPGLPQSSLEITKIQFNRDVGYAVLESYSRVLESLAATILSRIEDVSYADKKASQVASPKESNSKLSSCVSDSDPNSMTLSDFMGWNTDQGDDQKDSGDENDDECVEEEEGEGEGEGEEENDNGMAKTPPDAKKLSYLERLEQWGGLRSPTMKH